MRPLKDGQPPMKVRHVECSCGWTGEPHVWAMHVDFAVQRPQQGGPVSPDRIVQPDAPLKPALQALLLQQADQRGWIGLEPPAIAANLGVDTHSVVHDLWDFQKQGHLKFRESKPDGGKGESKLTALRLTSQGRRAFGIRAASEPADFPVLTPADFPPRQAYPGHRLPDPPAPPLDFPLTEALLLRASQLEAAAALLEQAGQDEMAVAALDAAKPENLYTPLEAEAVRLYRTIRP